MRCVELCVYEGVIGKQYVLCEVDHSLYGVSEEEWKGERRVLCVFSGCHVEQSTPKSAVRFSSWFKVQMTLKSSESKCISCAIEGYNL